MQSNIRIIELLRFLYQQTDEAHAVTVYEMIEYLKSKGIPSVRQTVYTDLEALDTAGIDIVQIKSTQNRYFIGSRIFEYPELKMLVDAVASSKVISAKKSQALIQKLGQLTSIQQAEQLQRLASLSSRVKPHNEKVYYIIDSIQTAILDQHQISFQYYEYTPEKKKILKHDGYRYILDPYALEWKNDHYYLIGYSHKHKFDLILEYHILRKNGAVLGETIFDDGPVILYDMDERSYKIIAVRKGTILIDERLCETRSIGRLRFTCAHELAHWVLHKNLYSGTGNIAAYNGQCSTDESDGVIERQADALATALLMPLPQIKKCFYRLRSGRTMEQIVAEMAQIFEVSKQAMQIRLQSHNLM